MQSEDQIQAQVFREIWNEFPETRYMLFHVPNGGTRNEREGMKLKSMGVLPGISDLLFIWKQSIFAIEVKTELGSLSTNQKKVHQIWRANGINTYICFGYEETKKTIVDIIYGRNMETRTDRGS